MNKQDRQPYTPPRWRIDLSLPPKDRYRELARKYKDRIQNLTGLFDALLSDIAVPESWIPSVNRLSRMLLRKVHNRSQTEELRGISEESGIPMYLLVAFNVVLDLLMGCTSGAVRTLPDARMLHFRTLDWTMEPLRQVIVQLDFVRSKSAEPDKIVATSITYVGFTGVLTGVRPGLSMSLNFRGVHDNTSVIAQIRFYCHHLLVLLGSRPSIATYLRQYLTGDYEASEARSRWRRYSTHAISGLSPVLQSLQLAELFDDLSTRHTTAAYLIFSDGESTISVDKDFRTAKLRRSSNFIATTNHDVVEHRVGQQENVVAARAIESAARHAAGFDEFLAESEDRLKCISDRWQKLVTRRQNARKKNGERVGFDQVAEDTALTRKQVIDWISKYPTTNECTHYAVVMDPTAGEVAWCLAYPEPMKETTERLELEG